MTENDVQWIKNNRKETTKNRTTDIVLIGTEKRGENPVTGEPVTKEYEELTKARVTEITSTFKTDLEFISGVKVEKGDLWVVLDLDDFTMGKKEIETVRYRGEDYTVLAADLEGIGELNRLTVVGRLES